MIDLAPVFFVSFLSSLFITFIIIRMAEKNYKLLTDHIHKGPQTFHLQPTPRLGGVAIFMGVFFILIFSFITNSPEKYKMLILIGSSIPVLFAGLYEDLTRSLGPKIRLLLISFGATLSYFLLQSKIIRTEIFFIDYLLSLSIVSIGISVLFITGLTNAINIIDGFNGLASGISIMIFVVIAYVAFRVGDIFVFLFSLSMIGAILGFFIFNYPYGLIFLGDGGAYFIGFIIAVLSILLVKNHPEVSAWFPITVSIYPIYETIFSIYRKKIIRKKSPMIPDGLHFHMIIYKIIVKKLFKVYNPIYRNPTTSLFVWSLNLIVIIPTILFWNKTINLIITSIIFIILYTKIYLYTIKLKIPRSIK